MLEDLLNSYTECANIIPGWKDMTKSDLCNLYIQNEHDMIADYYLAAIICKYWPKIFRLKKDTPLISSYEDCYDMVIDGIMYGLNNRRWLDEDSTIYKDKNGPDKAINRKIKCNRINFLIHANRNKRKLNIGVLSKDEIDENVTVDYECSEATEEVYSMQDDIDTVSCFNYLYQKKMYLVMFIYDALINLDCFRDGILDKKKLCKELREISDDYIHLLSEKYSIDYDELNYCYYMSVCSKSQDVLFDQVAVAMNTIKDLYYKCEI